MAFCSNCGKELNEGAGFCAYCGVKIGDAAPAAAPYVQPAVQPEPVRKQSMEEMGKLCSYFGQKEAQYREYDACNEWLDVLLRGNSKAPLVWGILIMIFSIFALLGFYKDKITCGISILFLLLGVGMIVLYGFKKKKNRQRIADTQGRINELAEELMIHYNQYGYCPVGAEYTNPAILERIRDVIRQGRADTIKEGINVILDDVHKTNMELSAMMTARSAAQAARGATTAAVFSAASFFLK